GEVIVLSGGVGRDGRGRGTVRVGEAAYISNRRRASKGGCWAHRRLGKRSLLRGERGHQRTAPSGPEVALPGQGMEATLKAPAKCAAPGRRRKHPEAQAQHRDD